MERTSKRRPARGLVVFAAALLAGILISAGGQGAVAHSSDSGWYDPDGNGCYDWFDGYRYTARVDCNGDGYADSTAGWYDLDGDTCYSWWGGYAWTGQVDCDWDGYADPVFVIGGATDVIIPWGNPRGGAGPGPVVIGGDSGVFVPGGCPSIYTWEGLICAMIAF